MNILFLLEIVYSGSITPFGRRPIDVTKNNGNETADYQFNFYTESDLRDGKFRLLSSLT